MLQLPRLLVKTLQGIAMPAAKSDAAAEAALGTLITLLGRVTLADGEQLTGLLQRLLPIATLPRAAAAEEVWPHMQTFLMQAFLMRDVRGGCTLLWHLPDGHCVATAQCSLIATSIRR